MKLLLTKKNNVSTYLFYISLEVDINELSFILLFVFSRTSQTKVLQF